MAEEQIEPRGEWRDDMRSGIIASTIANVNRDPKQRGKPYTAGEFTLTFGDTQEKQSNDAITQHAMIAFSILGGVGFGDNR